MSKSVSRKRRSRGKVFKTIGRTFKSLFNRIPKPKFSSKTRKNTRKRSRKQRGG